MTTTKVIPVSESIIALLQLRYNIGSKIVPGDRISRTVVTEKLDSSEQQHDDQQQQQQQCKNQTFILHAGPGTYQRGGYIYSSIVGTLIVSKMNNTTTNNSNENSEKMNNTNDNTNTNEVANSNIIVSVRPQSGYFAQQNILKVGQLVLGRVTRINNQQQQQQSVTVSILAVQDSTTGSNGRILQHHPEGTIRKEDIHERLVTTNTNANATSKNEQQDQQKNNTLLSIYNSFRVNDYILARIISLGDVRKYLLSTCEQSLGVIHAMSSISTNIPMIPLSSTIMYCPNTNIQEYRKCSIPPTTTNTKTKKDNMIS